MHKIFRCTPGGKALLLLLPFANVFSFMKAFYYALLSMYDYYISSRKYRPVATTSL